MPLCNLLMERSSYEAARRISPKALCITVELSLFFYLSLALNGRKEAAHQMYTGGLVIGEA